jgi:hypothetical protein
MTYDPHRSRVVLFGGRAPDNAFLYDTWEYDGSQWTNVTPAAGEPSPQRPLALGYDPAQQRVIGTNAEETWTWDGHSWTGTAEGDDAYCPYCDSEEALAYDSMRGRLVRLGRGGYIGGTWEWIDGRWERVARGVGSHALLVGAFDPIRSAVVVFGGYGPLGPSDETWTWRGPGDILPPTLHLLPRPVVARAGQTAIFSVGATGTDPLCYQWFFAIPGGHDTRRIMDGGRYSGAATPTLTITDLSQLDAGGYGAAVRSACDGSPPPLECEVFSYIVGLTVVCAADWDLSGSVNSEDLFGFLNAFSVGAADFNEDGVTNSQDFFDFIRAFFAGC